MNLLIWAAVGSLFPDIIRIAQNRHDPALPSYLKSFKFYLGLILLIIIGLVAAYFKNPADEIEAFSIGFAAPQIISSLAGAANKNANKPVVLGGGNRILSWWGK